MDFEAVWARDRDRTAEEVPDRQLAPRECRSTAVTAHPGRLELDLGTEKSFRLERDGHAVVVNGVVSSWRIVEWNEALVPE